MTITTIDTTTDTTAATRPLWRSGARAGVLAAAAVTAVAVAADAAGVPLEIDGEVIPVFGYAQLTLFFTAIGVGIARALRARRSTFVAVTVALTVLSLVPDLTIDATTATKLTLMLTHVVAAAIVIPRLAARLTDERAA